MAYGTVWSTGMTPPMTPPTSPRERWLHEGLTVLAELGAPALRIDRLAERLAMTKGSFYHHFGGLAGYKSELLAYFSELSTMRYIEAVESELNLDSRQKLNRLMTLVLNSPDDEGPLEIAFRAWAQQDPDVHDAQRRIDATRTDYLRDLCRGLGLPSRRALDMARVLYTVLIGSGHIVPPLEPAELRRLWMLTLQVLPPED